MVTSSIPKSVRGRRTALLTLRHGCAGDGSSFLDLTSWWWLERRKEICLPERSPLGTRLLPVSIVAPPCALRFLVRPSSSCHDELNMARPRRAACVSQNGAAQWLHVHYIPTSPARACEPACNFDPIPVDVKIAPECVRRHEGTRGMIRVDTIGRVRHAFRSGQVDQGIARELRLERNRLFPTRDTGMAPKRYTTEQIIGLRFAWGRVRRSARSAEGSASRSRAILAGGVSTAD